MHQKLLNVGIFSYGQFLMRIKFSLSNTKTGNSFGSQDGVADIYLLPQSKINNFNRANIIWQSYSAIFVQIWNIFIVIEDFLWNQKLLNIGIFSYGQFLMCLKFSLTNTKTGNSFRSQVGVDDIYLLPQSKISNFNNRASFIWQSYS